jgi:hypothetical protein
MIHTQVVIRTHDDADDDNDADDSRVFRRKGTLEGIEAVHESTRVS